MQLERQKIKAIAWRWGKYLLGAFVSAVAAVLLLIGLVYMGVFGRLPTEQDLHDIQNYEASEVYASDGQLLGKYFIENRTNVAFEEISPNIINALLATEDIRFYEHEGVDKWSLLRVFFKTILMGNRSSGGGSTISQQLAKNLFPRKHYSIISMPVNKIKEAFIATRLEDVYTKNEIMTLYLNTVSFGEEVYGIESAAQRYFNTSTDTIAIEEAALLVGMLKATTYYNPRVNPEASQGRRNVVLGQMVKYEFIDTATASALQAKPIQLDYRSDSHVEGLATYFREHIRQQLEQWCADHEKDNGKPYNLYTDGLKIYTTIDARMQQYAEEAMQEHMSKLQDALYKHWKNNAPWEKDYDIIADATARSEHYRQLQGKGVSNKETQQIFASVRPMEVFSWQGDTTREMSPLDSIKYYLSLLHAGFLAMDPQDGAIKAWVGGISHKYFQYDQVLAKRQPGSTFKPIVYAAALENGTSACEFISNQQEVYKDYDDWSPSNSNGEHEGYYSLRGALMNSVNVVSVKLGMETGLEKIIALAYQMGVESELPQVPSLALGVANVSLYEMVKAYGTFNNNGMPVEPLLITSIEDEDGYVLEDFEMKLADKPVPVLSEETVQKMNYMLQGVVNGGTATRLRSQFGLRNAIAGKTGTTQSHADGWFIGYTPNLVAGVRVGANDPRIHFRSISLGSGANMALPIWGRFMEKLNKDPEYKYMMKDTFALSLPDAIDDLECPTYLENKPRFWQVRKWSRKGNDDNETGKEPQKKETFMDKLKGLFKKKKK